MYCILVVDDEPKHRKGLINMIRQFRPDYIVNGAKNGQEALEFALANTVDILITDIKMPIMDGLELTCKLMENHRDIKIIILSAYANFDYAQKAISLGAFDYLLKPIDGNGIDSMLSKVEDKLRLERNALIEKKQMEKQLKNTLPVYLELQLNKWVRGNVNEYELAEIRHIFPFKGRGAVLCCEIEGYESFVSTYDSVEKEEIRLSIKQWIKEVLSPLGHSISFFLNGKDNVIVTILNTASGLDFYASDSIDRFNELMENLKTDFGFRITIGLSEVVENIFECVEKAYDQAIVALSYKFYLENVSVISFSQDHSCCNENKIREFKDEKDLSMIVRQLQTDKVVEVVNRIFYKAVENGFPNPKQFKAKVSEMLINQIKEIQYLNIEEPLDNLKTGVYEKLAKCQYFSQLKQETINIISDLITSQSNNRKNKYDEIMKKCIKYIETHYNEDISPETFAEQFYFNPSYFGALFKSSMGITLGQYLLKIRINKAKELLKETGAKVYEIATRVGYSDSKYFIRVFKNEVGLSPDEYRRIVLSGKVDEIL